MKIVDVRATAVSVPLLHEFKAAYGTRSTADFVIIEIEDDQGRIGLGEASCIPIYDEGSQAGVVFVINKYFKPLLIGRDPRNITLIMENLAAAVKGERYAKCAVDFALHDLVGKIYDMPVYDLLGGKAREVQVCWVLSAKDPVQVNREAKEKLAEGYRTFKLKVGTDARKDLENVEALRDAIGYDTSLRLDGNEAWEPKEALRRITEFAKFIPNHVEQPVPAWNINGLRFVREHSPIPVVADECILTPYDTMEIARADAADMVNIKVSRVGGIVEARKIAAIAEAAGQFPFAGSMLELGPGTVASAHFVAANAALSLTSELVGPLLLKRDILKKPLEYKGGCLILPEGAGFGIELDQDAVAEFTVKV
ncbi:mandelate racemase/muconate lactonizing enzyme family protein [Thermincola potens]|uniref:Mandelate racemase/muconate lactonizing protein n=1 Tax=Thermincola potens (strain JR) TaxID=635013 RepID=D5X9W8_THEPJ|nr:enolase C-terminal domain-like protein [Thermincola potens]ADG83101.1 Mandelate racemase/muconate lactonizing protein [Thermincola potens JR]